MTTMMSMTIRPSRSLRYIRRNHYPSNNSSHRNLSTKISFSQYTPKTSHLAGAATLYTITIFSLGYVQGQTKHNQKPHVLPSSLPRTCCKKKKDDDTHLLSQLKDIVGPTHIISPDNKYELDTYCRGARMGHAPANAVVRPGTLREALSSLSTILQHDRVVIPQGANTGLTGGSVPRDEGEEEEEGGRSPVVLNCRRLKTIRPVDGGERVLCTAGVGIAELSTYVGEKFDRESHSILGSTFLNPTVAAGVAFGSGGTQLRKGPAFTNRALYVKVGDDGKTLQVVNTLGIKGLEGADAIDKLDKMGLSGEDDVALESVENADMASDATYKYKVCDLSTDQVARFNADTSGIDVNRSEGKVLILATVNDTFEKPSTKQTLWVACKDIDTALAFRKHVVLNNPDDLPMSCEYMDRDSFDVVNEAGRISAHLISYFGVTHSLIGKMWDVKLYIESLPLPYADRICDKVLHVFNYVFFPPLSPTLMDMGKEMDHHMMITGGEYGSGNLEKFMTRVRQFQNDAPPGTIKIHHCTSKDANDMTAFRFVAATAFRTWCVGNGCQGVSVDYALPKNNGAVPALDPTVTPLKRMRYSHFGCNVVHEDLAYAPGVDTHHEKMSLKKIVEKSRKGRLPAEHGHGTEYKGSKDAQARWMAMDPSNVMNPGIGGLSATRNYKS